MSLPAVGKETEEVDHPAYIQDGLQSEEGLGQMLELQLQVVFPLELPSLEKILTVRPKMRVLDVGCGQGAWACRLAERFSGVDITGVDLEQTNVDLAHARARSALLSSNSTLSFVTANAYNLSDHYETFDMTSCRSMLYTVPHAERVVAEILKTLKPDGGVAHFLCEDYGMVFASPTELDQLDFWRNGPCAFLKSKECDPHMGRSIYGVAMREATQLGLKAQVKVEQIPVSTNPPNPEDEPFYRKTLGQVFQTWKDYSTLIADATSMTKEHCDACLDDLSKACNNPMAYVSWQCTVCTVKLQGKL